MLVSKADAGVENPRAAASLSVSITSGAESDAGSRPAVNTIPGLAWLRGGRDAIEPACGDAPPGPTSKVPLIATWPHAARTWLCSPNVVSVPASNAPEFAPALG